MKLWTAVEASKMFEVAGDSTDVWIMFAFSMICMVLCPLLCWVLAAKLKKASAEISLSLAQYSTELVRK